MPATPMHLFPPHRDKQASQLIVWLIGFFAFLNVYSMQAVLPMVMADFQASPVQTGDKATSLWNGFGGA